MLTNHHVAMETIQKLSTAERNLKVVGVAFDGNRQSLPGYFIYDGTVNRTVVVDVRGMTEALRKVYKADAIVDELLAHTTVGTPH